LDNHGANNNDVIILLMHGDDYHYLVATVLLKEEFSDWAIKYVGFSTIATPALHVSYI